MSALALVLMAGMAVPGIGPEKASGEVAEARCLDLGGEWEGTWEVAGSFKLKVSFGSGKLTLNPGRRCCDEIPCVITATSDGFARMEHDGPIYQGTCRVEGDRTIIFSFTPVNFKSGPNILILRRVRPRE